MFIINSCSKCLLSIYYIKAVLLNGAGDGKCRQKTWTLLVKNSCLVRKPDKKKSVEIMPSAREHKRRMLEGGPFYGHLFDCPIIPVAQLRAFNKRHRSM